MLYDHKEADVHSPERLDARAVGADLNNACWEGLSQGPWPSSAHHLLLPIHPSIHSFNIHQAPTMLSGSVLGVGTHWGPHKPSQELSQGCGPDRAAAGPPWVLTAFAMSGPDCSPLQLCDSVEMKLQKGGTVQAKVWGGTQGIYRKVHST